MTDVSQKVETLAARQHDMKQRVEKMGGSIKQMSSVMQELRTSQQAFEFNFTQQMTSMTQFLQQDRGGEDNQAVVISPGRRDSSNAAQADRLEREEFK